MSTTQHLEERIADYYQTEASPHAPNWLLTRALDVIDTTPQRRTVFGRPWRLPPMASVAKLAVGAVAIVTISAIGLTVLRPPAVGPATSPSPSPVTPTPSPRLEAEQIIAEGRLESFAASESGTLLTLWGTCDFLETDCGYAWRLGEGSQPRATGVIDPGGAGVTAPIASGDGFILTPARGGDLGIRIAKDGTASPLSMACRGAGWSTPTGPGRLIWVAGLQFADTVAGTICPTSRLGGPSLAKGVFTPDGALWALVDNETDPDALTIGRYDGAQWRYHDLAPRGGSWTSVIAAAGSNVVVLQAAPEPSPQQLVGLSVTTDAGATWSEVVDRDVLERDLPFFAYRSPDSQAWFSGYTSMAFAGSAVLYVADLRGDLWRSTDFTTFDQVSVPGGVRDLTSAGDAVIARIDNEGTCRYPAVCQLNDLVRISADGSVEPLTVR